MKKIISTALIAILLSTSMVELNAATKRRVVRRGQAPTGKRTVRRRTLPQATGKASPKQVTQAVKQAERDAQKLQANAQKAKATPGAMSEEKVVADVKKAEVDIKKIEQQLANLRSWAGDTVPGILGGGYSGAEKQKAFDIAAPYIREAAVLNQRIALNKDKITQITTKTWFGYGTPTVKPGKEQEYAQYNKLITAAEQRLTILNPIIKQQQIIMGKQLSDAVKAAYGTMAAIALTVTGLQIGVWAGNAFSINAMAQISAAASNIGYYAATPFSWGAAKTKATWNWITGNSETPAITQEQKDELANIVSGAVKVVTEENKQSWIRQFGQSTAELAYDILSAVTRAGGVIALEEGAKLAYLQAAQTLGNPKATAVDAEKAVRKVKDLIEKASREKEKREKEEAQAKRYGQFHGSRY